MQPKNGSPEQSDTPDVEPVAVVIVSWNSRDFLERALTSLCDLERPAAQIVVVDNGSTDGTTEIVLEKFPEVDLVECGENLGFCRANNLGFARTTTPFVLALNPDTELDPAFLRNLLPAFGDSRVGIACGKLLRMDRRTIDSAGQELSRSRQPLDRGYGTPDDGRFDRDEQVFGACGAAALYRREMIDSIADDDGQFFDETFFSFVEDLDVAWRARKLGWTSEYRARAIGYHARGGSASGAHWKRRVAAMLGRNAEVRFHIAKNRYLTIIRNDSVAGYLSNIPFIWARDLGTLALLLVSSPGVLLRLWKQRHVFFAASTKRRLDEGRSRIQV